MYVGIIALMTVTHSTLSDFFPKYLDAKGLVETLRWLVTDNKPGYLSLPVGIFLFRDPFVVQRKRDERNRSSKEYSGVDPRARTRVAHDSPIIVDCCNSFWTDVDTSFV